MLPDLLHVLRVLPVLAQSGHSSTFQASLVRILAVLCVLTILWLGVMYMLFRRTQERRRRQHEGLEPLPDLHVSLSHWFRRMTNPQTAPAPSASMPDLGMLTADLPQPDLADMLNDFADFALPPEPELKDVFTLPPEAPEVPAQPADDELAATFALDPAPYEELIPVQLEDTDEMPAPPDSIELLRVWRDLSDGSLIIEIGGQRFTSVGELQGANLDRRFVNVVRDLTNLLKATAQQPAPSAVPPAPPAQPPRPAAAPPAASQAAQPPSKPAEPPKKAASPDDAPSLSPGTMFRQMGKVAMGYKPEPMEQAPLLSVPDQIEQVLQKRLADLPDYAGRSIHVRPSPFGGVRIEVDGEYFDGVGDVADDEVRALLQDVVRQWEEGK